MLPQQGRRASSQGAPPITGEDDEGGRGFVPHVSICIVTHNASEHVRRCLESIRRRSHVPYELVVVDNASRPETRELLLSQPDLKLALNDENRLWCAGINQAMGMADERSDYL